MWVAAKNAINPINLTFEGPLGPKCLVLVSKGKTSQTHMAKYIIQYMLHVPVTEVYHSA